MMSKRDRRSIELLIIYAKTEIKNIEIILRLHEDHLTKEEVDFYLDKINDAKKRIEQLNKQLRQSRK